MYIVSLLYDYKDLKKKIRLNSTLNFYIDQPPNYYQPGQQAARSKDIFNVYSFPPVDIIFINNVSVTLMFIRSRRIVIL